MQERLFREASLGETSVDLGFVVNTQVVPRAATLFEPLADYLKKDPVEDPADIFPGLMQGMKVTGKQLAVPFRHASSGLHYNEEILAGRGFSKPPATIEEMIENVKARHAAIEQSAHLMTNIQIEFDGPDGAVVETYYLAYLRNDALPAIMRTTLIGGGAPEAGKIDMRSLGRYIDRFERRDGYWRIARRVCIAETLSGAAVPEGNPLSTNWAMASRDADDALWAMRAEFGLAKPE